MKNNYLLFMPSLMQNGCSPIDYRAEDLDMTFTGMQTNIPATEYVIEKLHRKGETLTKIILLCTDEVLRKPITPAGAVDAVVTYDYYTDTIREKLRAKGYSEEVLQQMFLSYDLRSVNPGDYAGMETLQSTIMSQLEQGQGGDLYLDSTGGLRSAAMLLTFFSRMLEKTIGVKMVQMLYSSIRTDASGGARGQIEDCTDTYGLFDFLDMMERKDLTAIAKEAEKKGNQELAKQTEATVQAKKKADAGSFDAIGKEERKKLDTGKAMYAKERMMTEAVNKARESTTREGALESKIRSGDVTSASNLIRNSGVQMLIDKGYLIWQKDTDDRSRRSKADQIAEYFFSYVWYYQSYLDFVRKMLDSLKNCKNHQEFSEKYDAFLDENLGIRPAPMDSKRDQNTLNGFMTNQFIIQEFERSYRDLARDLEDDLLEDIRAAGTNENALLEAVKKYNAERMRYVKTYATGGFPFANIKDRTSYTECCNRQQDKRTGKWITRDRQRYDDEYRHALEDTMAKLMALPFEQLREKIVDLLGDDPLLTETFPAVHMKALFDLRDGDFASFSMKAVLLDKLRLSRNKMTHFNVKGLSGAALTDAANALVIEFANWLKNL